MTANGPNLPADPDGMNEDRSESALAAIIQFQLETGTDAENAVADLLGNLMHMCDRREDEFGTFEEGMRRALYHYGWGIIYLTPETVSGSYLLTARR